MDKCTGKSKTLIRLTLQKPEISAGSMGHLARNGFSFSKFSYCFIKFHIQVQTKYNQVRVASLKPASAGAQLFGNGCDVISESSKETVSSDDPASFFNSTTQKAEKDSLYELKKLKERIESRL